jgi:hypothetical protein
LFPAFYCALTLAHMVGDFLPRTENLHNVHGAFRTGIVTRSSGGEMGSVVSIPPALTCVPANRKRSDFIVG